MSGLRLRGSAGRGADTVFEMEIGTNRPDAMNHYGVAREAAAIYEVPLKPLSAVSSQLQPQRLKPTPRLGARWLDWSRSVSDYG